MAEDIGKQYFVNEDREDNKVGDNYRIVEEEISEGNIEDNITADDRSEEKTNNTEDGSIQLKDEIEEPRDSSPTVPEKFSFHIKYKKWKKFNIKTNNRGDRSLDGKWTNVFAKSIKKTNPACPLSFRWNHVRKLNSRKKTSPFFTAKAHCKFSGCTRYLLKIRKEPKEGKPVKIKVRAIKPFTNIKHEEGVVKGRPITGKERKKLAEEIKQKGASNVFYEKLGNVDSTAFEAGNTSSFSTKEVLHKISSESILNMRLHKDVVAEVALLKKVYEKEDEKNSVLKGSIQSLSMIPFSASIYNSDQISLLAQHIRTGSAILYFDATGKVISNIPTQPKRVLYYPLILKGQVKGDPPVPVAELISNSHNTVDISSFFLKLNRDLHQSHPSAGFPQRIEIDFSWAFIHAILIAFNHENISSYLQRAWDYKRGTREWGIFTRVHICSAHLLHKISGRLNQLLKNKDARKYILYVIARMVDTANLEEIDENFRGLTTLLLSKNLDSHPDLERSISNLDRVVAHRVIHLEEDRDVSDEEEEDKATGTKPSSSVFAHHFRRISDEVKSAMHDETCVSAKNPNPYYSPEAVTYLLNTYMNILPLWTGLILDGDTTHDTNSPVENWMKIVKKDILGGKTRLTPSNFIIEVRANLKGRLREYNQRKHMLEQRQDLSGSTKKRKETKESTSFTASEEKWGGKKVKKGIYFSSPSKIPKPKKARLSKQKKNKDTRRGEKGLHWGGKVQFGDRVIHLSNTCTVDNLLMIVFYLLKKNHVRNWFEENRGQVAVCQVLLDINSLFESGNWTEGRALWLQKFLSLPTKDTWDVWGSEAEKFVCHFGEIQETEVSSSCSKRTCPRKERFLKSREILLGDSKANTEACSLEESIRQWEDTSPSHCSSGTPHGPCKGVRTSTKRKFVQKRPPILIMSVSYLGQARGLVPTALPDTVIIQDNRYELFAYTLGDGGHFKAYLHINNSWHKYDGLDSPEVSEVSGRGGNGQLEHVVYVLE